VFVYKSKIFVVNFDCLECCFFRFYPAIVKRTFTEVRTWVKVFQVVVFVKPVKVCVCANHTGVCRTTLDINEPLCPLTDISDWKRATCFTVFVVFNILLAHKGFVINACAYFFTAYIFKNHWQPADKFVAYFAWNSKTNQAIDSTDAGVITTDVYEIRNDFFFKRNNIVSREWVDFLIPWNLVSFFVNVPKKSVSGQVRWVF